MKLSRRVGIRMIRRKGRINHTSIVIPNKKERALEKVRGYVEGGPPSTFGLEEDTFSEEE